MLHLALESLVSLVSWRLAQHCHPSINFFASRYTLAIVVLEGNPPELKLCPRSTFDVFLGLRPGITVESDHEIWSIGFCLSLLEVCYHHNASSMVHLEGRHLDRDEPDRDLVAYPKKVIIDTHAYLNKRALHKRPYNNALTTMPFSDNFKTWCLKNTSVSPSPPHEATFR